MRFYEPTMIKEDQYAKFRKKRKNQLIMHKKIGMDQTEKKGESKELHF